MDKFLLGYSDRHFEDNNIFEQLNDICIECNEVTCKCNFLIKQDRSIIIKRNIDLTNKSIVPLTNHHILDKHDCEVRCKLCLNNICNCTKLVHNEQL